MGRAAPLLVYGSSLSLFRIARPCDTAFAGHPEDIRRPLSSASDRLRQVLEVAPLHFLEWRKVFEEPGRCIARTLCRTMAAMIRPHLT